MESQSATMIALDDCPDTVIDSPRVSLSASARIEFHVSVQLLAERASFLTAASGVAIALPEGASLNYCAAIGSKVSLEGNAVETSQPAIAGCIQNLRVIRVATGGEFKLLVPISTEEKAVGFFELVSQYEWTEQDAEAVTRLANLAAVALEHRVAAETAEAKAWQGLQEPLSPVAWHAPEKSDLVPAEESKTESAKTTAVNMCAACGFPVSPGRNLCVECEQKSDTPVPAAPELFSTQNQQSWISEHGYTVASLIVTALAAAVIFWLRR
jgi:GAF domain